MSIDESGAAHISLFLPGYESASAQLTFTPLTYDSNGLWIDVRASWPQDVIASQHYIELETIEDFDERFRRFMCDADIALTLIDTDNSLNVRFTPMLGRTLVSVSYESSFWWHNERPSVRIQLQNFAAHREAFQAFAANVCSWAIQD
jgi:hypothetical protein